MTLPSALAVDLRGRSLTRIRDWTAAEDSEAVLDLADDLKARQREREPHRLLEGRTLSLLFHKHSTRTRVSLESRPPISARPRSTSRPRRTSSRAASRSRTPPASSPAISTRSRSAHAHAEVEAFAATATVPVVNALTDEAHPLQALADLLTVRERFGTLQGLKVAWTRDGNNVCASLAEACALLEIEFACASPVGYEPAGIGALADPREAARGAHVLVTDVWTSMGQEEQTAARRAALAGYRLGNLLAEADPKRSTCSTACPRIPGRRLPPTSRPHPSGTRPRTGSTRQRRSSR